MKKKLLSLLCVVLLVVGAVVGTYAYLTDTDDVVNTFTVGQVGITLDEAITDEYGVAQGTERTDEGNEYKLIPGHTYLKDPTVTVEANSENSYIRMLVTVENYDKLVAAIPKEDVIKDDKVVIEEHPEFYAADGTFLLEKLCVNKAGECTWNKKWKFEGFEDGTYEFRYVDVVNTLVPADSPEGTEAQPRTLEALFTDITVPSFVEKAGLEKLGFVNIKVVAHAIQADGFASVDAAWTAFDNQHKPVTQG